MKKLRKSLRKAFSGIALMALCVIFMGQAVVFAAEEEYVNAENLDASMEIQEDVDTGAANQDGGDAVIYALGRPNGEIVGGGVRLRSKPSLDAPILALMYDGEEVSVVRSMTTTNSDGTWYYILHIKSNTWGYASANYIFCWDF